MFAGLFANEQDDFAVPIARGQTVLRLKCRKTSSGGLMSGPKKADGSHGSGKGKKRGKPEGKEEAKEKGPSRRGKERRIGDVVTLVARWRRRLGAGENARLSQEQAAREVKVSKKTLDDYLNQVNMGIKYGFDFGYYRDLLMGALRHFNAVAKGGPLRS